MTGSSENGGPGGAEAPPRLGAHWRHRDEGSDMFVSHCASMFASPTYTFAKPRRNESADSAAPCTHAPICTYAPMYRSAPMHLCTYLHPCTHALKHPSQSLCNHVCQSLCIHVSQFEFQPKVLPLILECGMILSGGASHRAELGHGSGVGVHLRVRGSSSILCAS